MPISITAERMLELCSQAQEAIQREERMLEARAKQGHWSSRSNELERERLHLNNLASLARRAIRLAGPGNAQVQIDDFRIAEMERLLGIRSKDT